MVPVVGDRVVLARVGEVELRDPAKVPADAIALPDVHHDVRLSGSAHGHNDIPGIDDKNFFKLVNTNFTSVCLFINHFLPILKKLPNTTIIGFGSIAAIRGRSLNATYAASKRALESYFESLRHFVVNSPLTVQFYMIGYIDTNLSFGADMTLFKPAQVDRLANIVFNNRFMKTVDSFKRCFVIDNSQKFC